MPYVASPEAYQNDRSYVRELSVLSILYAKFSMVGGYTEDLKKPRQNWRMGACAGMGDCPGQYSKNNLLMLYHLNVLLPQAATNKSGLLEQYNIIYSITTLLGETQPAAD